MLPPLLGPLAGPDEFPIQFQRDGRRLVNVDLLHVPCNGRCTHVHTRECFSFYRTFASLSTALLLKQRRCLWVGKASHSATLHTIESYDYRNTKHHETAKVACLCLCRWNLLVHRRFSWSSIASTHTHEPVTANNRQKQSGRACRSVQHLCSFQLPASTKKVPRSCWQTIHYLHHPPSLTHNLTDAMLYRIQTVRGESQVRALHMSLARPLFVHVGHRLCHCRLCPRSIHLRACHRRQRLQIQHPSATAELPSRVENMGRKRHRAPQEIQKSWRTPPFQTTLIAQTIWAQLTQQGPTSGWPAWSLCAQMVRFETHTCRTNLVNTRLQHTQRYIQLPSADVKLPRA